MLSKTVIVALVASFSAPTLGHMVMSNPVPYGKSSLNNSPLAADGSDFPCKQRSGVYDAEGASNVVAIGDQQQLQLTGSAVHGGGSCQVSLTTDKQPTKDSKWMVIKSIEGGCPMDIDGNNGDNPGQANPTTFPWSVPEGITPGDYTLAWTWFNRIGNREMYMNCAPLTVTGAKKKRYNPNPIVRRQSSFPAMYIANLNGVTTCKTSENNDYIFPNPGDDVMKGSTSHPTEELDASCMGGSDAVTPSNPSPPSNSGTNSSPSSETSAPSSVATTIPGGSDVPTPPSNSLPTESVSPSSAPAVFASAAQPAPSSSPSPPTSSSSSSSSSSGACTPGTFQCIDGASFKICDMSGWSVPIQMAAGTHCTVGANFQVEARRSVVRRELGLFQRY
jgi:hypothetical protein